MLDDTDELAEELKESAALDEGAAGAGDSDEEAAPPEIDPVKAQG